MNETKLIEVTTDLNDKDFLNQLLIMEISKISMMLKEKLEKYKELESVKKYLSIDATINIIKLHYKDQEGRVVDLEREKQQLIDKYKEIQEIEELKQAIRDYKRYQDKLKNSITTNDGIIYSSIDDSEIELYSIDTVLKHLFTIKKDNYLTEEEIKAYFDIVKKNITTFKHFDDDLKEEFLIIKLYKNPESYQVESIDSITSIEETENYYYDETNNVIRLKSPIIIEEDLTEREKNAFYNEEAYKLFAYEKPKENIKTIKGV